MDTQSLRCLVFGILKKNPQTHLHAIENEIRQRTDEYERRDVLALQEIIWDLLVQGVLAPGKNSLNLNLPFVHLTKHGARCLDDGSILAHDPERYIERLMERTAGKADPVIIESVREGLLTYLAGRHTAASVMLARAAERLFDLLIRALIRSGKRAGRGTKRLEALSRSPKSRHQAIQRALIARELPAQLAEDLEPQLAGLQTLIQLVCTDDGTPRIPALDRDRVLGYVLLFPDQCRFVYHLIDHLEGANG